MKTPDEHTAAGTAIRQNMRMDFVQEVLSADEVMRIVKIALKPDPRRYIEVKENGQTAYLDKYLNHLLPPDILEQMAAKAKGLPIYQVNPTIDNAPNYSKSRLEALKTELDTGDYVPPAQQPYQHKTISVAGTESITFLSVDICGATALRTSNDVAFDAAHEIMMRELGTVVGHFGASILKPTGDGFIAFNNHRSFTRQCDNVIDLGLSLIRVQHTAINEALSEKGLPKLDIRVGAEHGSAKLKSFHNPTTGFGAVDVVSDALNRAVKIQESCGTNQFRIGRRLYELIHVQWLERAELVAESIGEQVGDPNYRIYRVT